MKWPQLSEAVAVMAEKAKALDSRTCKLSDIPPEKRAEEIAAIAAAYVELDEVCEALTAGAKKVRVSRAKAVPDEPEKPRRAKRGLPSIPVVVPPSLVNPTPEA